MASYRLSSDVYTCVTDDCIVLLALSRNQYIALEHAKANRLVGYVEGWPSVPSEVNGKPGATQPPAGELLREMIGAGLLTTDLSLGREPTPPALERPESALVEIDYDVRPRVVFADLIYLVAACATAGFLLRFRPFHSVVRRAELRRLRRNLGEIDIDRLRTLTAAFIHLRPICFGARRKCVLDSLALLEFLALHRIFPSWVFGVVTGPFAAHCWVQAGSVVCNDTPDHVRRYAPILVV